MTSFIVGVGTTAVGRHPYLSVGELAGLAVRDAVTDAGIDIGGIEAAFYANTRQGVMEGQHGIRGQVALRPLGIEGVPIINTDNACASSAFAVSLACAALDAGTADVAVAVGAEKMWYPDRSDRMYEAFLGSWDVAHAEETAARLARVAEGTPLPEGVDDHEPASVFMAVYAAMARQYMAQWGVTSEQLAHVAAKSFSHGTLNPKAMRRRARSPEEVLADELVAWPLTKSMCAPISDGAGALLLVSERVVQRFDTSRAIAVRASSVTTGVTREVGDHDRGAVRLAAERAFVRAGVGPSDIDVAEVHDATTFGELLQLENIGFFPRGEAGIATVNGETRLGGRLPVNTSGGLLSKGHPTAASGAIQIADLATQLRGEAGPRQVDGARWALAECGGGFYGVEEAAAAVTVLEGPNR